MTAQLPSKERLEEVVSYDLNEFSDNLGLREEWQFFARALLAGMEQEPVALHDAIKRFRESNEGFPIERFKADFVISWVFANYAAPVVSEQADPRVPDYWVYDSIFGLDICKERPPLEEGVEQPFPVFKSHSGAVLPSEHAPLVSEVTQVVSEQVPVDNYIGSKNALDAIVAFIKSNRNPTLDDYKSVSERLFTDNCQSLSSHVIAYIEHIGEALEDYRQDESCHAPVVSEQPAPVVVQDERAAFEKFIADTFGDLIDNRVAANGDGEYFAWDMQVAWMAWQASAAMLNSTPDSFAVEKAVFDALTRVSCPPAFMDIATEACRAAMLNGGKS